VSDCGWTMRERMEEGVRRWRKKGPTVIHHTSPTTVLSRLFHKTTLDNRRYPPTTTAMTTRAHCGKECDQNLFEFRPSSTTLERNPKKRYPFLKEGGLRDDERREERTSARRQRLCLIFCDLYVFVIFIVSPRPASAVFSDSQSVSKFLPRFFPGSVPRMPS